jgi:hypothetical protein
MAFLTIEQRGGKRGHEREAAGTKAAQEEGIVCRTKARRRELYPRRTPGRAKQRAARRCAPWRIKARAVATSRGKGSGLSLTTRRSRVSSVLTAPSSKNGGANR